MDYKVISAFPIQTHGVTDVAIDAPQRGIPDFKTARDEQGNLYEVLHPTLLHIHELPKASFLLQGIFKGEKISLYTNSRGEDGILAFKIHIEDYDFLKSLDSRIFDYAETITFKNGVATLHFKDRKQQSEFQKDFTGAMACYGMDDEQNELTAIGYRMENIYDQYFLINDN